jgi:hypothetical protein
MMKKTPLKYIFRLTQFDSLALFNDSPALSQEQNAVSNLSEAIPMNGSNSSRFQGFPRVLCALLASSAMLTAGCANMVTTATGSNSLDVPSSIGGKLYGGNQPVSFATVNLWFAGQGVGSLPTIAATTMSANDGYGSFSFTKNPTNGQATSGNTFSCPANDPLVYVVATGGNTLNSGPNTVNNSAAVFLAPYGDCFALDGSSYVNMTEVTTVATMAALQQYFNPASVSTPTAIAESFATDGTGQAKTAISNAFNLISNMVNLANGQALTTKTIPYGSIVVGTGASGTSVTATPEAAKINLIANILASCVNNASATAANCTTLFNNATPPDPTTTSRPYGTSFSNASDTLQAAYYMLTNPTNGSTTNLTNLFNLSSAIGAPFQPSLTSAPSDWTIAISYSSTSTCGTNTGHLINSAQDIAIDTYGGVWIANNEPAKGNLTLLSSNGIPVTCLSVGSGANTGIAIDSLGAIGQISNIWLADSGSSNVYRYKPGNATPTAFPITGVPRAIAADGTGNIYYTTPATTTLYELPQATTAATVIPAVVSTLVGSVPAHVMVDNTPAVWTTSGSNFVTRSASSSPNSGAGFTSTSISSLAPTYGISITAIPAGATKNYVYVGSDGGNNTLSLYQGIGTSYSSVINWPATGLSTPSAVVSDGAQNVWAINNASGANSLVAYGIGKQNISPAAGFQKAASYLGSGRSLIIDQSGNLWIGLDGTNSITEIVGAAVPVVQPYATALKTGNFQLIP